MPLMMNVAASAAVPSATKKGMTGTMAAKAKEIPITLAARCGFGGLLGRPSSSVIISCTHWSVVARDGIHHLIEQRAGDALEAEDAARLGKLMLAHVLYLPELAGASSDSWSSRWLFVETYAPSAIEMVPATIPAMPPRMMMAGVRRAARNRGHEGGVRDEAVVRPEDDLAGRTRPRSGDAAPRARAGPG